MQAKKYYEMLAEWEELERHDKIDPASMQALRDKE